MNRLRLLNEKEFNETKDLFLNFPWTDQLAYAEWLAQTYSMVSHSTRLVALASGYTSLEDSKLHERFLEHAKEERGHQWMALSDLKNLGYALSDFSSIYPTESIYQIQYYWIQHKGAASLLGYILVLETLASHLGIEVYHKVRSAHGEKASVFLECHAEEDPEHLEKAYQIVEQLSKKEILLIEQNLSLSANLYRAMLREIQNVATRKILGLAA